MNQNEILVAFRVLFFRDVEVDPNFWVVAPPQLQDDQDADGVVDAVIDDGLVRPEGAPPQPDPVVEEHRVVADLPVTQPRRSVLLIIGLFMQSPVCTVCGQATGGMISVQFRSFDLVQIVHIECISRVVEISRGIPDDYITTIGDRGDLLARWRVTDSELAEHWSLTGLQWIIQDATVPLPHPVELIVYPPGELEELCPIEFTDMRNRRCGRLRNCGHTFIFDAIHHHLRRQNRCPLCRRDIRGGDR